MITATYIATGEQPAQPLEPGIVTDILWSTAVPADGLEHIYATTGRQEISLVLFHRADQATDALAATTRICRTALEQAPALTGYRLLTPARTRHPDDAAFSDRRHLVSHAKTARRNRCTTSSTLRTVRPQKASAQPRQF
ncbi:hypothetical protein [Streptomyces venezuelae]|uniref:hypothetical protein n=1 Tax=Streptomyces venezuelae TaxID=54571 RepID=UPI0037ADFF9F